MCLHIDAEMTYRILHLFDKNGGELTMYKAVWPCTEDQFTGTICYPFFASPFRSGYEYQSGWNHSDRGVKELSPDEIAIKAIYNGIHVFTFKEHSRYHMIRCTSDILLPVTVFEEDFVCAGDSGDAVFMKIFIDKDIYNKALQPYLEINKCV